MVLAVRRVASGWLVLVVLLTACGSDASDGGIGTTPGQPDPITSPGVHSFGPTGSQTGETDLSSPVTTTVAASGPPTQEPAPGPTVFPLQVTCKIWYRKSVTRSPEHVATVELQGNHDIATASRGSLRFHAELWNDPYDGVSFKTSVSVGARAARTETLYQFGPRWRENPFQGGHGFTGLMYSYSPDAEEMQHTCSTSEVE